MTDKLINELQDKLKDLKLTKKNGKGEETEEISNFVINRNMLENYKKSIISY
jgi:hypothetical protein